jgi:hypothetical protein
MSKKTTAILTTAGFAIFATPALAEQPDEPGKKGRETAAAQQVKQAEKRAEQQAKKDAKSKKAKKAKGVGFTLSGTGLTSLPVADGALTGPLTLDVISANKHARTLLSLDQTAIAGTTTFPVGSSGDAVLVRFEGLTATDALQATDTVKVIGKVTRVRKGDETTVRTLDIRKLVVTRGETEAETEQPTTEQPTTEQSGS